MTYEFLAEAKAEFWEAAERYESKEAGLGVRFRAEVAHVIERVVIRQSHDPSPSAYGRLLGIEGAEDTTDLTTSKPTLSGADQTGDVVELDFDKSVSDRLNIYAKRGDEPDFIFLR